MSNSNRRAQDLQQGFVRQSVILRNNLGQFDERLRVGEDWPSMLGRINAALVSFIKNDDYYCKIF